jgi:hypothetical protein
LQRESPKLVDADHEALVEALKGLTSKAEVHVTKLSAMTKAQQVELIGRAEVSAAPRHHSHRVPAALAKLESHLSHSVENSPRVGRIAIR